MDPDATIFEKRRQRGQFEMTRRQSSAVTAHGTVMHARLHVAGTGAWGCATFGRTQRYLIRSRSAAILAHRHPESTFHSDGRRFDKSLAAICAKANGRVSGGALSQRFKRWRWMFRGTWTGSPVAAHRESFFEKAGRFYRRYRFFILLIAAYLVSGLAILLFNAPHRLKEFADSL